MLRVRIMPKQKVRKLLNHVVARWILPTLRRQCSLEHAMPLVILRVGRHHTFKESVVYGSSRISLGTSKRRK
jgi:hypothetical protein